MSDAPPNPLAVRFSALIDGMREALAATGGRGVLTGPMLIVLWARLRNLARRFAYLLANPEKGALTPRRSRPKPAQNAENTPPKEPTRRRPPPFRFPTGFAWLLPLVPGASTGGSRLIYLLYDPEMKALLDAIPKLAEILRPLCRMLGVPASILPADPRPRAPRAPRPPRPPRPRKWRPRRREDLLLRLRMGTPLDET